MAKGRTASNKKDREKAMQKKRKDKEQRKEVRKAMSGKGKGLDDMIAYVDAYGNIVSTPPDPASREEINAEEVEIKVTRKEHTEKDNGVRRGTVSFFNESKGYGFIRDDESGESLFAHVNNMKTPVKENDKVTFTASRGEKGRIAVNIQPE